MKKEFLEFLIQKENPPELLKWEAKKDIVLSFKKKEIILKFLAFNLLGAIYSLSICPQYGIGLVEGHGIAHLFRMMGDWACAAFCGSLFLGSGMMACFIGMKGEELWWVWKRYKFSLIFLPALFWGALMLLNVKVNFESEIPSYHLVWVVAAVMIQALLLKSRTLIFVNREVVKR